jgi:hypothetical protein
VRLRDGRDRFLLASAAAAALLAAGCSAHTGRTAGVATSFNTSTMPPLTTPAVALATSSGGPVAASTDVTSGSGAAATPCPVPSPELFVEAKKATTQAGQVLFSYINAQRICAGDESARFVATGTAVTTKPVSPSAVVLLLAPDGGSNELQVPTPALPAAMASDKAATFYAITLDGSGAITRIEQAYHP